MNPSKYRQAKEIYWQVEALDSTEREKYLQAACDDDPELRAEIERLLAAAHNNPERFLEPPESPAVTATLEAGTDLGHYRIVTQIGRGGMGEVYRAQDTSLKRDVALKVLPSDLASDPQRLERFQREAESIAALNHPNIVTIYSIEQDEERRFLTMELVEGESLDHALPDGGFPIPRVIKLGVALADALAAAHEKGIVHRDLKPSNVMLTKPGDVKVLDFGLAKMSRIAAPDDAEAATQMATLTKEGVVVGTAAYMSPEQAQGQAVDHRSDVFSLGCLLYEAATGHRPFHGASSIDILHNIIHAEPQPLVDWLPEAPLQLHWILRKCLAKAPTDRYQAAADLAVDLRALEKDLDSDTGLVTVISSSAPATPSSPSGRSRRREFVIAAVTLAVLAVAIVIGVSLRPGGRTTDGPAGAKPISLERLTSTGKVTGAAISPDGNFFAYSVTEEAEGQSLGIQQIARGQSLELVPRQRVGYWSLGFTPDGSEIYFAHKKRDRATDRIYRVSTLGGAWQMVAEVDVDSLIGISPDGLRMAWFRAQYPTAGQSSLVVANTDGTDIRPLVSLEAPDYYVPVFFSGPGWSPDGRLLAGSVNTKEPGKSPRIEVYDADTGAIEWSKDVDFAELAHTCWLREGDGILFVAQTHSWEHSQIWLLPYPEGSPTRVTTDLYNYRMLTLTADGKSLLTVASDPTSSMWITASDASTPPRSIPLGRRDGLFGFSLTPDGRLVYPVERAGNYDLVISEVDGSNQLLLTSGPEHDILPTATPDGAIVYAAVSPSDTELRRLELEGGTPMTLVRSKEALRPDVSRDGEWVVYQEPSLGFPTLWRVPATGGDPEQLTTYESMRVDISPDGTQIAFLYRMTVDHPWQIGITPLAGGSPEKSFAAQELFDRSFVRWTEDGEALYINSVTGDRSNLYRLPLDGGEITKVTDYTRPRLSWVDFSPDGEFMVFTHSHWSRDAILIENFR